MCYEPATDVSDAKPWWKQANTNSNLNDNAPSTSAGDANSAGNLLRDLEKGGGDGHDHGHGHAHDHGHTRTKVQL